MLFVVLAGKLLPLRAADWWRHKIASFPACDGGYSDGNRAIHGFGGLELGRFPFITIGSESEEYIVNTWRSVSLSGT